MNKRLHCSFTTNLVWNTLLKHFFLCPKLYFSKLIFFLAIKFFYSYLFIYQQCFRIFFTCQHFWCGNTLWRPSTIQFWGILGVAPILFILEIVAHGYPLVYRLSLHVSIGQVNLGIREELRAREGHFRIVSFIVFYIVNHLLLVWIFNLLLFFNFYKVFKIY